MNKWGKGREVHVPAELPSRACPTAADADEPTMSSSASGMLTSLPSAKLAVEGRGERFADWERACICEGGN